MVRAWESVNKSKYAFLKPVWIPPVWVRTFTFFLATLLLFALNCTRVTQIVESDDPYHTETFKKASGAWSREARIHRGLGVELIVSATFKSEQFRRAYADEYARAYMLTPEKKEQFLEAQLVAATHGHEFLMASFVPERKWNDFDKGNSMWKLYLVNDQNERVVPVEVRKVKQNDAVTPHFFPHITPWKSTYTVRFPRNIPASNQPIIKDATKGVKLVITSVLGTAEMDWKLE
jgi:hypothetical protein